MALGLPPKHKVELPIDIEPHLYLALAVEASVDLGWEISKVGETGFLAFTKFSMKTGFQKVVLSIGSNSVFLSSESHGVIYDRGKNKRNIEYLTGKVDELKNSLGTEELQHKYEDLKSRMVSHDELMENNVDDDKGGILALFKPAKGYFITPILINLNLLVFICMVSTGVDFINPDSESLIKWGGNLRSLTLGGEWWRLLTSCFIHIGVIHLLFNMYALVYVGLMLEPYLGKSRFLAAYILTGITSSLGSLWWHDNVVSAGASGAIFGMYGVFLAMLTTNLIDKAARQAMLTSVCVFVGYNLLNGMKAGVDNAGHVGGLLGGLIIGYGMIPSLKRPEASRLKFGTLAALVLIVICGSFVSMQNIPNNIGQYQNIMEQFSSLEEQGLGFYKLNENAPREVYLSTIKSDQQVWNKIDKLLTEVQNLDLPEEITKTNRMLREYTDLRIRNLKVLYKAYDEYTNAYDDSINSYSQQLDAVLTRLNAGEK